MNVTAWDRLVGEDRIGPISFSAVSSDLKLRMTKHL